VEGRELGVKDEAAELPKVPMAWIWLGEKGAATTLWIWLEKKKGGSHGMDLAGGEGCGRLVVDLTGREERRPPTWSRHGKDRRRDRERIREGIGRSRRSVFLFYFFLT